MKIKQIENAARYVYLVIFIAVSSLVTSSFISPTAMADNASDFCNSVGYTNAGSLNYYDACVYGYNTASRVPAGEMRNKCSEGGFSNNGANQSACAVGAGVPNNKVLATGADAACESVGFSTTLKSQCVNSYNNNQGLTDAELAAKCGGKGNACYVGGKLKNAPTGPATIGTAAPTTQDYCDRIYGTIDPQAPAAAKAVQRQQQASCKAGQQGTDCRQYTGAEKQACEEGADNSGSDGASGAPGNTNQNQGNSCGGATTNLIPCSGSGESAITGVLVFVLQIMTVGVGVLAVGGILYGAILYASAQDNAGQTKKGIEVITNTVIGLLLYLFMFAILNLLVPGGVLA